MSYKHITFNESEVFVELEKLLNKQAYTEEYYADIPRSKLSPEGQASYDERISVYGNLVLDALGFIPIYGDILDIARGIVNLGEAYFETDPKEKRNKLIDAMFNFLSAVPLYGSFVGKGGKQAFKAYKAASKNKNNILALLEFLRKAPLVQEKEKIKKIFDLFNNAFFFRGVFEGFGGFEEMYNTISRVAHIFELFWNELVKAKEQMEKELEQEAGAQESAEKTKPVIGR